MELKFSNILIIWQVTTKATKLLPYIWMWRYIGVGINKGKPLEIL
jgi:hypothetical protein